MNNPGHAFHPDPQPKHYGGLDLLRAIAISLTLLYHYCLLNEGEPAWLADGMKFGWTGVDLFFVLSGFLISSSLFEQITETGSFSYRSFFIKRSFRILPAFWVVTAIYFLVPFFREKPLLPPLWKFLSFTQNLGLDLSRQGAFSHCWSLCVEEHFYLLLPLVLFLFRKRIKWLRGLLIAVPLAGLLCRWYSYRNGYLPHLEAEDSWVYWYRYVYYPTYNRLDGLCAGVAVAALYRFYPKAWKQVERYANLLILGGLLVLTGAYFLCLHQKQLAASVFGFPLVSLGYGMLVAGAVCPGSILYRNYPKPVTRLALWSYGIYLTHKGVIHMTQTALEPFDLFENVMLLLSVAACIIAAVILYWMVEKPALRYRRKLLRKREQPMLMPR